MTITVMVSETCRSLGDAMRDLDTKAVIRSDFILVSGQMVANLNFLPILEHHRFEIVTDVCHVISNVWELAVLHISIVHIKMSDLRQ
jgi:translation initiation factor eIF-2B subunit epsilon